MVGGHWVSHVRASMVGYEYATREKGCRCAEKQMWVIVSPIFAMTRSPNQTGKGKPTEENELDECYTVKLEPVSDLWLQFQGSFPSAMLPPTSVNREELSGYKSPDYDFLEFRDRVSWLISLQDLTSCLVHSVCSVNMCRMNKEWVEEEHGFRLMIWSLCSLNSG